MERKQWFCRWCGKRIVSHQIGGVEVTSFNRRIIDRRRRIWVHLGSNVIWCRPLGERTLVLRTATPRFSQPRKWSHA